MTTWPGGCVVKTWLSMINGCLHWSDLWLKTMSGLSQILFLFSNNREMQIRLFATDCYPGVIFGHKTISYFCQNPKIEAFRCFWSSKKLSKLRFESFFEISNFVQLRGEESSWGSIPRGTWNPRRRRTSGTLSPFGILDQTYFLFRVVLGKCRKSCHWRSAF